MFCCTWCSRVRRRSSRDADLLPRQVDRCDEGSDQGRGQLCIRMSLTRTHGNPRNRNVRRRLSRPRPATRAMPQCVTSPMPIGSSSGRGSHTTTARNSCSAARRRTSGSSTRDGSRTPSGRGWRMSRLLSADRQRRRRSPSWRFIFFREFMQRVERDGSAVEQDRPRRARRVSQRTRRPRRRRIGLLLGMAGELKLPLAGIVDMACAALCDPRAHGFNPALPVVVVDLHLEGADLTIRLHGGTTRAEAISFICRNQVTRSC